jgi:hypothetical protein
LTGRGAALRSRCEWHGEIVDDPGTDPPTGRAPGLEARRSGLLGTAPGFSTYAKRRPVRFVRSDPQRKGRDLNEGATP